MLKNISTLATGIAICEGVGVAGGVITSKTVQGWYQNLKTPSINSPSSVFAPVWTTLYALMGIAVSIIYQKKDRSRAAALIAFGVQLALNFLWTVLFFGLRTPFGAFIEIIILWVAILITIILFLRISRKAALLLVPYLLWVSFASLLNFKLWRLNR